MPQKWDRRFLKYFFFVLIFALWEKAKIGEWLRKTVEKLY